MSGYQVDLGAREEMPAGPDPRDLTLIHRDEAGAGESPAARPLAQEAASDQLVVGAIPQPPPGFQPRPELMAQLNRTDAGVSVIHAATGLLGVGTTQLAAAYARAKLADGWRLVAWVSAGETGSLLAGLAAVADAAGLSDGGSGRRTVDAGRAVRHWLEAGGNRCLIVFDDAGDPDALQPFVPADGAARVLITSTRPPVTHLGTSVSVDVFSADEALAFLTERTSRVDAEGAAAVAAELARMPLALAQAAAVIAGQYIGYGAYLDRLGAMSDGEYLSGEQPYPHGSAKVMLQSLDAVQLGNQGVCVGVMEMLAVLSAAGVRRELLRAAGQAGVLATGGHRVAAALVDQALEQLADRSLLILSLDGQTAVVHRLVTQVVRNGLVQRELLTAACRATASVLAAQAEALVESRDRWAIREISQQVTALLDTAGPATETDGQLAQVLLRLRFWALYHLIELGDSTSQAIAVGEPLTTDLERLLGPDHRDTLNARNSLAAAYQAAGRAAEATRLFEQTLVGRERLLGPDHPDTLNSQNNLAATYQDAGRLAEAILLFELTLAARERLLGADDPSTVNSRGNLAAAYRDAGRTAEAIPLLEQTLVARERALGPDHPDTLRSRNNLANAYRDAGRTAEAIPLLELTLAARVRLLGPDHRSTLALRNNLAAAYRDAGRAAEAIPLLEQNLAACERLLGADHPRTLATRNSLALAYQEAGQAE